MRRFVTSLSAFIVFALVSGLLGTPAASAQQQSVNLFVGGFVPRSLDARARRRCAGKRSEFPRFQDQGFRRRHDRWGMAGRDRRQPRGGSRHRLLLAHGAERVPERRQRKRIGDLAGSQAAHRAVHGHRALPAARPPCGDPAVHRRRASVCCELRYSETGKFVDSDNSIFNGNFVGSGTATGPVILGGVRFPIDRFDVGGEIRYQSAKGDLPADQTFAGRGSIWAGSITCSRSISILIDTGHEGHHGRRGLHLGVLCASSTNVSFGVAPVERQPRAFADARESVEKVRVARARASRACRRPRPSPRSESTRHTAAGSSSAASQMSPLPSCRKSRSAKPSCDVSCM